MTKEELLKRLHEILEIVGPDRAFEISENTNERKTLWIHQTPGEDEYLMLSATKLFPISTIRNIVYEYGEDIGSYSDTDFILCFELNGDCDYTVEFGGGFENGTYVIYYDGNRWHATEEDTDWLKKYNERMRVKESMSRLIWTAAEFSKEANAEELLEVKNKAVSYFDEYPEDHELLLTYTYLALCMLYNEEEDHFDARWAIQLIAKRKLKEKLLQHTPAVTSGRAGGEAGKSSSSSAVCMREWAVFSTGVNSDPQNGQSFVSSENVCSHSQYGLLHFFIALPPK